jgi:hypothetical protein
VDSPLNYDVCAWPEMGQTFGSAGFELERVELRYYQSIYYKFFVPLFFLFLCYDLIVWGLSANKLCSQMLIIGRRR